MGEEKLAKLYPLRSEGNWAIDGWDKFEPIIKRQFQHGGEKYAFDDVSEWTDVLTGMSSAWLSATVSKYAGRFKVFGRERDLIKIFTYAFIGWLQEGNHIGSVKASLEATTVAVKDEHFESFVSTVYNFISESVEVRVGNISYSKMDIMAKFDPMYVIASIHDLAMEIAKRRGDCCRSHPNLFVAMAAYSFIEWFHKGFHLAEENDEDTAATKVDVEGR